MKKSLIALAITSAFITPAFAATSNVEVYGLMTIAIQDTNVSNVGLEVVDNDSRIGFKGSEDLGGGLKAIWQIENGLSNKAKTSGPDNTGIGGQSLATRNTFIGLSGGFGTVLMGRHDTPYKMSTGPLDPFSDTIGDYNGTILDGVELVAKAHDIRSPATVYYRSPDWSGFSFAAALIATNNEANYNSNDSIDAFSLSGAYKNGPLYASLAYQSLEDYTTTTTALGSDAWKLGLGYTVGSAKLGFVYENVEKDLTVGSSDRDSWVVNGIYNIGAIDLKAHYGQVDNNGTDQDLWALGMDYKFSKRTLAYLVYGTGDDGNDTTTSNGGDVSGWNIGMKHSF
jgi:predicted porin